LKSLRTVAALRNLRSQALWRLLAADKSPVYWRSLQTLFARQRENSLKLCSKGTAHPGDRAIAGHNEELPQTAQAYIADWLTMGG